MFSLYHYINFVVTAIKKINLNLRKIFNLLGNKNWKSGKNF